MGSIKKSRAHDLRQTGVMLLLESFWNYPGAWGKVGIETLRNAPPNNAWNCLISR